MITNLFSIFDPSIYIFNTGWLIIVIPIVILFKQSTKNSKFNVLLESIKKILNKEIYSIISNKKPSSVKIIISIFFIITVINLISLMPFNFTVTSQISFNLPISLTMWIRFLILGWTKQIKHILSHLLPLGTPNILMPVIVLIEFISQIIRPITLSVRLTANIIAGHLLLSLLGRLSISRKTIFLLTIPASIALRFLEICVPIIQAYVFITLTTLYSTEIN